MYGKQTLAKATKKVSRALPTDLNKRQQVLTHEGQNLGLFQKPIFQRTQGTLPANVVQKILDFHNNDSILWQAAVVNVITYLLAKMGFG